MRKLLLYGGVGLAVALGYLAWVFAARQLTTWQAERRAETKAASKQAPLPPPGFKILLFYADKNVAAPGEPVLICYGVQDAKALRLDPPVEKVWPALSRCFPVRASETTTYRLIAEGNDGNQATASLTVKRQ